MTLDSAQKAFRANPSNDTAGDYLTTVSAELSEDNYGDDPLLDAIAEVAYWLKYNRQML